MIYTSTYSIFAMEDDIFDRSGAQSRLSNKPPKSSSHFVITPKMLNDESLENIDLKAVLPPSVTTMEAEPLLGIYGISTDKRLLLRSQLVDSLLEIDPSFFTDKKTQELIKGLKTLYQIFRNKYTNDDTDQLNSALWLLPQDQRTLSFISKPAELAEGSYHLCSDKIISSHSIHLIGTYIKDELNDFLVPSCDSPVPFDEPTIVEAPPEFRPIGIPLFQDITLEKAGSQLGISFSHPLHPTLTLKAELAYSFLTADYTFFKDPVMQTVIYDIHTIYSILLNLYASNNLNGFIASLYYLPEDERSFGPEACIDVSKVLLGLSADAIDRVGVSIATRLKIPLKAERKRKESIESVRMLIESNNFVDEM
ncbi:MAG: hypothetical protein K2Q34_06925 [Alphaproteobacteria bacterium]|nr:hypothetical protein [Alphaproteobacteria bacterium]